MAFLDSEKNEGRELEAIAKDIVEGYLDALLKDIKKPALPLRQGMLIKSPADGKVRRVAYLDEKAVWLITDNASHGWLGYPERDIWQYCEEFTPSKMVETGEVKPDGKPVKKRVDMTEQDIDEAWSNPDWKVGQRVSFGQRMITFEIIAVGPACVLMRKDGDLTLWSEPNANMEKFYRREIDPDNPEW